MPGWRACPPRRRRWRWAGPVPNSSHLRKREKTNSLPRSRPAPDRKRPKGTTLNLRGRTPPRHRRIVSRCRGTRARRTTTPPRPTARAPPRRRVGAHRVRARHRLWKVDHPRPKPQPPRRLPRRRPTTMERRLRKSLRRYRCGPPGRRRKKWSRRIAGRRSRRVWSPPWGVRGLCRWRPRGKRLRHGRAGHRPSPNWRRYSHAWSALMSPSLHEGRRLRRTRIQVGWCAPTRARRVSSIAGPVRGVGDHGHLVSPPSWRPWW